MVIHNNFNGAGFMADLNMHIAGYSYRTDGVAVHIFMRIKFMISALILTLVTRNPLEQTPLTRLSA